MVQSKSEALASTTSLWCETPLKAYGNLKETCFTIYLLSALQFSSSSKAARIVIINLPPYCSKETSEMLGFDDNILPTFRSQN